MQILAALHNILTEKGISVPDFSNQAGIPSGRVYKWLDKNVNAKPKNEDVALIEKWFLENYPEVFRRDVQNPDPLYSKPNLSDERAAQVRPLEVNPDVLKDARIKELEAQVEVLKDVIASFKRGN